MQHKKQRADFSAYIPKKRTKPPVIKRDIVLEKPKKPPKPKKERIHIYLTEDTINALTLLRNRNAFIESEVLEKIERIHLKHKKTLRDFPQSL